MNLDPSALKHVLFVCYAFPPVGGAGVQRSVKFVKYLPAFGWAPTVLTVQNPSVPVLDYDLLKDIPNGTEVLRSRTYEPSYRTKGHFGASRGRPPSMLKGWMRNVVQRWLQPDLQVLWNRTAYRLACKAIRLGNYKAIYVSGPPFSSFLLGCRLKRRFALPLVLDFRDEWSLSAKYLENQSHRDRMLERQIRMFQQVISQADAILATTQSSTNELRRCCEQVHSQAVLRCIYNGFDPDDFSTMKDESSASQKFRLTYTGTLWRLTTIEPLVRAIEQLSANRPGLAQNLELQVIGRRKGEQDVLLDRLIKTPISLIRQEYLPHQQALNVAKTSDGLLLLLANEIGAERVVPAKLFEYLALRRPILGICPPGEATQLLSRCSLATAITPEDIGNIEQWLAQAISEHLEPSVGKQGLGKQLEAHHTGHFTETSSQLESQLEWCDRRTLTRQLSEVLCQVIGEKAVPSGEG